MGCVHAYTMLDKAEDLTCDKCVNKIINRIAYHTARGAIIMISREFLGGKLPRVPKPTQVEEKKEKDE